MCCDGFIFANESRTRYVRLQNSILFAFNYEVQRMAEICSKIYINYYLLPFLISLYKKYLLIPKLRLSFATFYLKYK